MKLTNNLRKVRPAIYLALITTLILATLSCGKSGGDSKNSIFSFFSIFSSNNNTTGGLEIAPITPPTGNPYDDRGRVRLYLTDFPLDGDQISKVLIDLRKVRIKSATDGWRTVVDFTKDDDHKSRDHKSRDNKSKDEDGKIIDLLRLQNGRTVLLGDFYLKPDDYTQVRLILGDDSKIEANQGSGPEIFPLNTPSGNSSGLTINRPFTVPDVGITTILLDFNAKKSIVKSGAGCKGGSRDDKSRDDKSKDDKSRDDKSRDDKSKDDKSRDGRSRGDDCGPYLLKPVIKVARIDNYSGIDITSPSQYNFQTQLLRQRIAGKLNPAVPLPLKSFYATFLRQRIAIRVGKNGAFSFNLQMPKDRHVKGYRFTINAIDAKGNKLAAERSIIAVPQYYADQILVRFHFSADNADIKNVITELKASVVSVIKKSKLYQLQLAEFTDVKALAKTLKADARVSYALPNYYSTLAATPNDTFYAYSQWSKQNSGQTGGTFDADIDAPEAWDLNTGNTSVMVAVIDDGMDLTHPDLSPNLYVNAGEIPGNGIDDDGNGFIDDVNGYDFRDMDGDPSHGVADGHGTRVAGIIGARGNNGTGVAGTNWNVTLLPIRVHSDGDTDDDPNNAMRLAQAADYAITIGADINNISWRGIVANPTPTDIADMNQFIKDLNDLTKLQVMSAGNEGIDLGTVGTDCTALDPLWTTCYIFPAQADISNKIVAASTDHNDALAPTSNFGTDVHVGAPGQQVITTSTGGGYFTDSGTSFAAAHVSGVAALLVSHFPQLKNQGPVIKQHIEATVDVLPSLTGLVSSNGRINAFSALSTTPVLPLFLNATPNIPSIAVNDSHLIACDVDNDSDIDVIVPVGFRGTADLAETRIFINDGNGNFTDETATRFPGLGAMNIVGGDCRDINNDGYPDIVLASFTPPTVPEYQNLLLMNGGLASPGVFTNETVLRMPAILDVSRDVKFAHLNGDGLLDIYVSNAVSAGVSNRILINVGTLSNPMYADETAARIVVGSEDVGNSHNAHIADVDGDGDFDIYVVNQGSGSAGIDQLLINNGTGIFTNEIAARITPAPIANSAHEARFINLNGTAGAGYLVIAHRGAQANSIYQNDGSGNFANVTATLFPVPLLFTTSGIDVADLNGDGFIDILFGNGEASIGIAEQNHLMVYNNSLGIFEEVGAVSGIPQGITSTTKHVLFFDADGDGDIDVWLGNVGEPDFLYFNSTIP